MKQVVFGMVAGLALLALSATAQAQHGSRYYGDGYYSQPYVQPQYSQYGYAPNYYDPYANSGPYLNYSTPGFGIYSSPGYGPGISIYSGPSYGRSYYPTPFSGGYGHYQSHHHHHHHR